MTSKLKYIVVCGQDLKRVASDYKDISTADLAHRMILRKANPGCNITTVVFPEARSGSNGVIEHINTIIDSGDSSIIYTRYPQVIQAFGEAIEAGRVHCKELLVVHHENVVGEVLITQHFMTSEGHMQKGWPFGSLW